MKIIISLIMLSAVLSADPAHLIFVGDINFTGRIGEAMDKHGHLWAFEKVKDELRSADYTVGNLESPAGVGGYKYAEKRVYFKANPKHLDALSDAGFDMVSLANNHALDYGPDVLKQTRDELDKRNIKYIGIRNDNKAHYVPKIVIINGLKIAFFGYCNACPNEFGPRSTTAGVNVGMKKMIKEQVLLTKHYFDPDFIVAMPHWGSEYFGVDKNQLYTKSAMLESGVDIVVGAHPHVLQWVHQTVKDSAPLVAYSLGNFIFPMRWEISMSSAMLHVFVDKIDGEKKISWRWTPVKLDSNRPEYLRSGDLERFKQISHVLHEGYDFNNVRTWPEVGPWQK